jgi:hypothetical protein
MKRTLAIWSILCLPLVAGTLTFEEPTQEITTGVDAAVVTADFKFKNESDEDVVIEKYDAACTCINAQIKDSKLAYKPGESGVIRAAFDMGQFSGTNDKSIALWLKGDPAAKPSIVLTARITIPVLVEVEPKSLIWEIGTKAEARTVDITMKHDEPIRVTSVSGADARFKYELKTVEEGKKYQVVVTPASTQQVGMGVIHIETDCKIQRHRSHRIFTVIRQPLPKPAAQAATPAKQP